MNANRVIVPAWIGLVVLALAWGVAAFGSPYPWAYGPLLIASVVLGAGGVLFGRGRMPWTVVAGLLLIAGAAGFQMVPLALSTVDQWSPSSVAIHRQQNLQVALGVIDRLPLSIDASRTQLGILFLGGFALLLVGAARLLSRESTRTLAVSITVLGVIVAMVGIIQRATFNGKIYGFWELQQGGSPFGPYINRNHFAGWMLMALPLAIGVFMSVVSRGMRGVGGGMRARLIWFSSPDANKAILLGFAILTMALSLVLTLSRSGMLALVAALVFAAIVMARRQATLQQRVVVTAYLAFVVLTVAVWVGLDQIAARFDTGNPTALSGRPAIWADTVRIAQAFPWTGTGLNTFGVSTLYYQTSEPGEHLREAHSDYLQLAAEGGALVCVPIVLTILAFVSLARVRLCEDIGSIWWLRIGAVIGLLAVAAQSSVEFSLQMPGNAALFAVLAGIALHDSRSVAVVIEKTVA